MGFMIILNVTKSLELIPSLKHTFSENLSRGQIDYSHTDVLGLTLGRILLGTFNSGNNKITWKH